MFTYSGAPIVRTGSVKQAVRIFTRIQINKQDLIRASRVENGQFLYRNGSEQGRILRNLIDEQALISMSRLEKSGKKFLASLHKSSMEVFP